MERGEMIYLEVINEFLERNVGRAKGDILCRDKETADKLLKSKVNSKPVVKIFDKEKKEKEESEKAKQMNKAKEDTK